jgi:hypothetical protein
MIMSKKPPRFNQYVDFGFWDRERECEKGECKTVKIEKLLSLFYI